MKTEYLYLVKEGNKVRTYLSEKDYIVGLVLKNSNENKVMIMAKRDVSGFALSKFKIPELNVRPIEIK